ncbi:TPA: hypothetical protein ACG3I5_002915 [Clostridioides difficile]
MEFNLTQKEEKFLEEMGINIFSNERKYWFIRTQGGFYYNSFVNENYVGIEWDEISDLNLINGRKEEELRLEIVTHYPKIERPGYPIGQIMKFAHHIKKGDIVLIPSENCDWISIGEFLDDKMYIYEEEASFEDLLDQADKDENKSEKRPILKKRRNVKWIKSVKKTDLDPYLYSIIHIHYPVTNINEYSDFIDRALSQFYIKGNKGYFTYKVNKKKNIPYRDMLNFLNSNDLLMDYINNQTSVEYNMDELVIKINVQSKGPVQLKGSAKNILIFGLIITGLFGANFKFKVGDIDVEMSSEGLPALLQTVSNIMDKGDPSIEKVKNSLDQSSEKLEVSIPEIKQSETTLEENKTKEIDQ